jgi:L-amino acid N-acyltransferase YncA
MVVRQYSVRPARADDADAICAIYNEGIADRATLETEPRTPEDRRSWLAARDARYPVVVVESDGVVVGWASLNVFNARDAYRHVADISVYVARAARGKGAGTALLERLVELGRDGGFHKLVLAGFPANAASVALYQRLGFREVGIRDFWMAGGWTSYSWRGSSKRATRRSGPEIAHSGALRPPNGTPSVQSVTLAEPLPERFR